MRSLERYNKFKEYKSRILVSTDMFGRGVDFERVNIVFNYDMPEKADQYLHRVGRSGRFGTKGLAISFVSSQEDSKVRHCACRFNPIYRVLHTRFWKKCSSDSKSGSASCPVCRCVLLSLQTDSLLSSPLTDEIDVSTYMSS